MKTSNILAIVVAMVSIAKVAAENTMTFVVGDGVCTPITVSVGGRSFTVNSSRTISQINGTIRATDCEGRKLKYEYTHIGSSRSGSKDTYTFYPTYNYDSHNSSNTSGYNRSSRGGNPHTRSSRGNDNSSYYISKQNFDSDWEKIEDINSIWDVKYNNRPIVVDVYDTYSQPCAMYSPAFSRIAREYNGKVDFYRMDIDSPNSQDFAEIGTVPATFFIWDPNGDASVKHLKVNGILSDNELKQQIEAAIAKQYKFQARQVSTLSWDDSFTTFPTNPEYNENLLNFVGEWKGIEDGYESRLWVENGDGRFTINGGTLNPERQRLTDTVYWLALGAEWSDEDGVLYISDILPDKPASSLSRIMNGTLQQRAFRWISNNDNLQMTVEVYRAKNMQCEPTPYKTYTVIFERVK